MEENWKRVVSACVERWAEGFRTYVEPSPEHPRSVLINLQHLDVVNGESEADGGQDEQSADQ